MNDERTIEAPAKLNLWLRVLRRRPDGFHEVETLMVRLPGLSDVVRVAPADGFSFACNHPSLPVDDSNLVVRAVRVFEEACGESLPVRVVLEKRVPYGAGLGSGSSDAAATLRALDSLRPGRVEAAKLLEISARLGSDVPFFLGEGAAVCRGRGELIARAPDVPSLPVVLLKPSFGVATPEAYRRWRDSKPLPGVDYDPQWLDGLELVNDLERPVFAKHLFLAEAKQWLRARDEVSAALMSGSGSTMFAVLRDPAAADALIAAAKEQLDPTLWTWAGTTE